MAVGWRLGVRSVGDGAVDVTINIRAEDRGLAVGKGEEVGAVAVRRAIESRRGKGGGRR